MYDDYDVKGPVHRIEQRLQSVDHLQFLQHHRDPDSFDVEFSPSHQAVQQTNYTFGAKIEGFERFIYAEWGELVRTLDFDSAGRLRGSTDFHSDNEGRCVGWTKYDGSGGVSLQFVRRFTGNLVVSSATSDVDGLAIREEDFEYAGGILSKSIRRYYSRAGILSETWISRYNPEGQLTETFGLNANGGALGDGRYTYEYDVDGRETRVWNFNEWSEEQVPNAITVHEYTSDEVGNWVKRSSFHRFRTGSRWTERITNRKLTYFP
jgi:hypothetical protein